MADSVYQALRIERQGKVARLVMNRPEKLNSFDATLRQELIAAVAEINADPEVRIAILTGEGRAFCAGADLGEGFAGEPQERGSVTEHMLKTEYKPSLLGITESAKLWIAEVRGAAAGIGSAYMLACDLAYKVRQSLSLS